MSKLIPRIKTTNANWPDRQALKYHNILINKYWKSQNDTSAGTLPEFSIQNRSSSQARDISWDMQTVSHLLKRTVTGSTLE